MVGFSHSLLALVFFAKEKKKMMMMNMKNGEETYLQACIVLCFDLA